MKSVAHTNIIILLNLLLLIFCNIAKGQSASITDELEIKRSNNYHWGEAVEIEKQRARELARQDLAERILVRVTSESGTFISDVNSGDQGSYESRFEQRTETLSRLEFRGLNYLEKERRDGSWQVTAYLSKEDFQRTIDIQAEEVYADLDQALELEENGSYSRAMSLFQQVFTDVAFLPLPVYADQQRHGSSAEIRSFVKQRIINQLEGAELQLESIDDRSTDEQTALHLNMNVSFGGTPLELLNIGLDRRGYGTHEVVNGRVAIYEDRAPTSSTQTLTFLLVPLPAPGLATENAEIFALDRPEVKQRIEINFDEVIDVKADVVEVGAKRYRLIPEIRNLRVNDLFWEIDGERRIESSPLFRFGSRNDTIDVHLNLNRDDNLTVSRQLTPDGNLIRMPIQDEETELVPEDNNISTADAPAADHLDSETSSEARSPAPDLFEIKKSHQRIIDGLLRQMNASQLLAYLRSQAENQHIRYGNRDDVSQPGDSYIVMIRPQTNRIHAILSPPAEGYPGYRLNMNSGRVLNEDHLRQEFSGLGSLWIELVE